MDIKSAGGFLFKSHKNAIKCLRPITNIAPWEIEFKYFWVSIVRDDFLAFLCA